MPKEQFKQEVEKELMERETSRARPTDGMIARATELFDQKM